MSAGNYAAAWALFRGLERYQEPEDDEVLIAIVDEFGEDAMMRGLALVGAVIRAELRQHAEHVGCRCGSDEWLDEHVFDAAAIGDDEGGHG